MGKNRMRQAMVKQGLKMFAVLSQIHATAQGTV